MLVWKVRSVAAAPTMTVTARPSWAEQQAERRRCAEVAERQLQAARRYQLEAFTEAVTERDGTAERVGSAAAVTTAATTARRGEVSSGGQLGASVAGNAVALGAAGAAGRRLSPARRRLPPSVAAAAPACQRTGQAGAPLAFCTLGWPPQPPQPLLGPGRPGRLSTLSVFLCKSVFYGTFVWARRALNSQKRRFAARAVNEVPLPTSPEGAVGTAVAAGSGSADR
jgi:hypothetical protein